MRVMPFIDQSSCGYRCAELGIVWQMVMHWRFITTTKCPTCY